MSFHFTIPRARALGFAVSLILAAAVCGAEEAAVSQSQGTQTEIDKLKGQVAHQQEQLEALRASLNEQKALIESLVRMTTASLQPAAANSAAELAKPRNLGEVASLAPAAPPASASAAPAINSLQLLQNGSSGNVVSAQLAKLSSLLGGLAFSGDFRLRADVIARSGNHVAGPAQNARGRYRLRFNVDKDLFLNEKTERPLAKVHVQLATEPLNNPLTQDADFAGFSVRAPISLGEAWVDLNPTKYLSFRGGRGPEVFSEVSDPDLDKKRAPEGSQFVFDDDIRFNGFHQIARLFTKGGNYVELKAGQYILANPNVQIVPAGSPYIAAGYAVGKRVPSSDLFDQGIVVRNVFTPRWNQLITGDYMVYRNPNQIAFASTAAGAPVIEFPATGITLTGPLPQTGNGTTTAGGAIFTAAGFQIIRGSYQLNYAGWKLGNRNLPVQFWLQGTHNTEAGFLSNGYFGAVTIGEAKKLGDVLFSYRYHYKQANAFISQFSDDDVGSGLGVNIKTHAPRVDFGINRFLTWENRIYIQDEISRNDPARLLFVTLQRGAKTTYRYQGQFLFKF